MRAQQGVLELRPKYDFIVYKKSMSRFKRLEYGLAVSYCPIMV